jgi:hypothetical protein
VLEQFCPDLEDALFRQLGSAVSPWKLQLIHDVLQLTERRLGVRLRQLAPGKRIQDLAPTPLYLPPAGSAIAANIEFFDRSLEYRKSA